jgi:hypothetical protein
MKLAAVCLLVLILGCQSVRAQALEPLAAAGTVYLGLGAALPLGKFQDTYPGGRAYGANLGILVKPGAPTLPFEVGLEAGYLADGISQNKAPTQTPPYTIKTTHSYIPLHAVLRLKPKRAFLLTPYVDGLAGITIFNTRSKIKQDFFSSAREEEATVLDKYNSTVFSYGLAAGLYIKGKNPIGRLDIRLVYLESPLATYVKRGNLAVDPQGYPVYRFSRSETTMLLLQLNVAGLLPAF